MTDSTVLVVDLDGTLLRTDMLLESFWGALARDWRALHGSASALMQGKASLKAYLADGMSLDPALLPYNEDVIEFITRWRSLGGKTALVTASDQRIAAAIAGHLGLFDEVHGSDGQKNLKGRAKADFLVSRFGDRGFDYIGDSAADMPVWRAARRAIVVDPTKARLAQMETLRAEVVIIGRPKRQWRAAILAMRPHQWLKNALLFVPLIAAHSANPTSWLAAVFGFLAFSFVASSVYLLNDLLDLSADRHHVRKKDRPLPSGALSLAMGSVLAPLLLVTGVLMGGFAGSLAFVGVLAGYYALTVAYSMVLKRRLIIDICTLAGLYTIRVIAGGVVTGIHLSEWLIAFSMFIFLSLAAMKRQTELVDNAVRGEAGVRGRAYRVDDLPIVSMIAIAAGYMAVLVLALYINSPEVQQLYKVPLLLWACCPILLYWVSRMAMIAHRGQMDDDPILFVVRDRIGQLCIGGVLAAALAGVLL